MFQIAESQHHKRNQQLSSRWTSISDDGVGDFGRHFPTFLLFGPSTVRATGSRLAMIHRFVALMSALPRRADARTMPSSRPAVRGRHFCARLTLSQGSCLPWKSKGIGFSYHRLQTFRAGVRLRLPRHNVTHLAFGDRYRDCRTESVPEAIHSGPRYSCDK